VFKVEEEEKTRGRHSKGWEKPEAAVQRGERRGTRGWHSKGRERGKLEVDIQRRGRGGN